MKVLGLGRRIISWTACLMLGTALTADIHAQSGDGKMVSGALEAGIPYQDIASGGPLTHVYVGTDASAQLAHALDGTTYEFFPPYAIPGDAGTFVVVDGTLYAPNFAQHGGSATGDIGSYVPFTPVSQSSVTGSGTAADPYEVVSIMDIGSTDLRIIQTDTYVEGLDVYRTDVQISNSGPSAKSLILYRAVDCYLGTSDFGYGLANPTNHSIACTKNPNNTPPGRVLQFLPLTEGSHYYQAFYASIWSHIGSHQPFPDTCHCGEYIDNGLGLSWNVDVPAGGQVQYSHLLTFSPQGGLPLTIDKTADGSTSTPGESNGYTITIDNPNSSPATVISLSDHLPPGFAYVEDTTSGFVNTNPSVSGQTLTWSGNFDVPASGGISLHFGVLVSDQPGVYTNNASGIGDGSSVSPAVDAAPITVKVDVAPISTGFLPNPDGYSFANWGGHYPFPPELFDYTNGDTVAMFGEDETCAAVGGGICILKWGAALWNKQVNFVMNNGHCDGMTTTALRFYTGIDQQGSYQPRASTTFDLDQDSIRRHVAWNFVLQFTDPVSAEREVGFQKTPNQVLQQIYLSMLNNAPDPINLAILGNESGHSILPYAIEDEGDGEYRVKVYDNNYPDDADRFVVFNTQAGSWSYDMGDEVWSGSTTRTIVAAPLSVFLQQPECPWCAASTSSHAETVLTTQTWYNGQGHLLIVDSTGRRIGYVGEQFINEIPGAFGNTPLTGLGIPAEPVYSVPASDPLTIQLNGSQAESAGPSSVAHFAHGHSVLAEGIILGSAIPDQLEILSGGTGVVYTAGQQQELDLTLARDEPEYYSFRLEGIDVANGESVQVTQDPPTQLTLSFAQASGGLYTLQVKRIDDNGLSEFLHPNIAIDPGDTQLFYFQDWDGAGAITMCTDVGSDGTLDTCPELENESSPSGNQAPVADAGSDQLAECAGYSATVGLDGSGSSDPDSDSITCEWTSGTCNFFDPSACLTAATCPFGDNVATLVVNDGTEDSEPDTVLITVEDTTAPAVTCQASRSTLWPPNHKMVDVGFGYVANDNCDPNPLTTDIVVSSDEDPALPAPWVKKKDAGAGECPDAEIAIGHGVKLRAERLAGNDGRVYAIKVTASDSSGNVSSCDVTVDVPKDGPHDSAVDSGQAFDPTACDTASDGH